MNCSVVSPGAQCVLISVNPKAGAGGTRARVEQLAALLREKKLHVEICTDLQRMAEQAAAWQESGDLRAVVAAGGDGTAAEILNRTPPGTPLAIFPQGTENLLARHLGITRSPVEMCALIAAGSMVQLDAGNANGRLFLLMVSCGFDANVIERMHRVRQGNIRHWHYIKPMWQALRSYTYPELRLYFDGLNGSPEVCARWAFLFNLPRYAFGLPLSPLADGADGLLDLCALRRGQALHGLWYLWQVLLGSHHKLADCTTARVRKVRIEADARVPYQLDGDPGGVLPLEIQVLAGRATVLAPLARTVEAKPTSEGNPASCLTIPQTLPAIGVAGANRSWSSPGLV